MGGQAQDIRNEGTAMRDESLSRRALSAGLAAAFLTAAGFTAGGSLAQAQRAHDPAAVTRFFYSADSDVTKAPFSRRLKAVHAAAEKKANQLQGPVKGTEFEPYLGGQNEAGPGEPRGLKITAKSTEGDKALVEVTFRNGGTVVLNYELVREGGVWRVDDIVNTSKTKGWRWSALLAAGARGEQS
jgi:hypothetical protein